jgi:hypothetical protein
MNCIGIQTNKQADRQKHTHTHTKAMVISSQNLEITFLFPNGKKGKRFGKFLKVVSSFWKRKEKEKECSIPIVVIS